MTAQNFAIVTPLVLQSEGGYVNNSRDPGGPTNKGCTLAECRAVYGKSFGLNSLHKLTVSQASGIFKHYYWDEIDGDYLTAGVDYALYDYAINSGVGRANRVIRALCGISSGKIATAPTLSDVAIIAQRDPAALIDAICDERLAFMRSLTREWPEFGHGWTARVLAVRTRAKRLALAASVPHAPAPSLDALAAVVPHDATPKAKLQPPSKAKVASSTVAAAFGATAPAALGSYAAHHVHPALFVAPACAIGIGALVWAILHSNHAEASTAPALEIDVKPKAA